jgi:hypothetical protein
MQLVTLFIETHAIFQNPMHVIMNNENAIQNAKKKKKVNVKKITCIIYPPLVL